MCETDNVFETFIIRTNIKRAALESSPNKGWKQMLDPVHCIHKLKENEKSFSFLHRLEQKILSIIT